MTNADGSSLHYAYDKAGNLIRETDADGGITRYTYDLLGQVTNILSADGTTTEYEYNADGEVISELVRNIAYSGEDGENHYSNLAHTSSKPLVATGIRYTQDAINANKGSGFAKPVPKTPTPAKPKTLPQEYAQAKKQATTPTQAEYVQLRKSGVNMSYGQYVNQKQQTRFPSYGQYAYDKQHGKTTYQTYGPLQSTTGQINHVYDKTPNVAAKATPKVESIDARISRGCNAPGANTNALGAGNYDGIGDSIRGLADTTSGISSISSFAYGSYHTMNSSLVEGEAGRLVDEAYNFMERGLYGSQVTKDFELSAKLKAIGRRSSALSGVAAFAGGVIDLIYQLKTNASVSAAVTKTASHVLLGMAGGAIAAALVGAIPAIFVVAASAAVSIFLSNQVDRGIDYIEEKTGFFSKIDNMVSDFLFN